MAQPNRIQPMLAVATTISMFVVAFDHSCLADDLRDPSVGVIGRVEQIVLPGTEVRAKPIIDTNSPVVLRIANVFPHGDAWRYDLEFYGLEPGSYNLVNYLERIDGSETSDLPPIEVQVLSLLPPGQIEPNELGELPGPWLGGYRLLAIAVAIAWIAMLGLILFAGRKSKTQEAAQVRPKTLADYLKPRIEQAMKGELSSRDQAELERMLIAYWKGKLNLDDVEPAVAIRQIKADLTAGPLVRQIERWMHDSLTPHDVSLPDLLKPYKEIQFDDDMEVPCASSGLTNGANPA